MTCSVGGGGYQDASGGDVRNQPRIGAQATWPTGRRAPHVEGAVRACPGARARACTAAAPSFPRTPMPTLPPRIIGTSFAPSPIVNATSLAVRARAAQRCGGRPTFRNLGARIPSPGCFFLMATGRSTQNRQQIQKTNRKIRKMGPHALDSDEHRSRLRGATRRASLWPFSAPQSRYFLTTFEPYKKHWLNRVSNLVFGRISVPVAWSDEAGLAVALPGLLGPDVSCFPVQLVSK